MAQIKIKPVTHTHTHTSILSVVKRSCNTTGIWVRYIFLLPRNKRDIDKEKMTIENSVDINAELLDCIKFIKEIGRK